MNYTLKMTECGSLNLGIESNDSKFIDSGSSIKGIQFCNKYCVTLYLLT